MNIDRAVLTLAGTMVLISLALAWLVSPYWLLFTAFVGANMLQASFTGWRKEDRVTLVSNKPFFQFTVRRHRCSAARRAERACIWMTTADALATNGSGCL